MPGRLQPLVQNQKITRPDGTPTDYFIKWAQQRQIDIVSGITAEQAIELISEWSAARQIIAGAGLDGGGPLSADVTLDANASDILDLIDDTWGSILFRGTSGWEALAPGTSGHFLKTNGASADPAWAAGGGGGGGGGTLIEYTGADLLTNSAVAGTPALILKPAYASTADAVNGIWVPVRSILAGETIAPCIYDGGDPTTGTPAAAGAPQVAVGPGVAIGTANRLYWCPFSAPFVPTVGRWYYVGIAIYGSAGNVTFGALGYNERQLFNSGTHNPPPLVAPTMTGAANNNAGFWTA